MQSRCWREDQLVDWVGGSRAWELDGTEHRAHIRWGYRFDAATSSPDGRFAVIYERLGTKGLLIRDDATAIRELNRSFYQAHVYEYPVCLWNGPDGRLLLAHCPDAYNQLEIEDAEAGERLTASTKREPGDQLLPRFEKKTIWSTSRATSSDGPMAQMVERGLAPAVTPHLRRLRS